MQVKIQNPDRKMLIKTFSFNSSKNVTEKFKKSGIH